jgi:hypothetical protein
MARQRFNFFKMLQEEGEVEPIQQGPLLAAIGDVLTEDVVGDPDGAFLYAEVQPGVVAVSIFKDVGDRVMYSYPSTRLADRLSEAWEALDPDKRWTALSFTISGDRFSADFQFPDELNSEEDFDDRLEGILKDKFGEKPIDYSTPLPDAYK